MLLCYFDRPLFAGGTHIVVKAICVVFWYLTICIVLYMYGGVCFILLLLSSSAIYLIALIYDLTSYEDVENNKV